MESAKGEHIRYSKDAAVSVRGRIVAMHDKMLRVAPVDEHIVEAFEDAVQVMTSKKGREAAEKLGPVIALSAKNAEVALAAGDLVLGVATTGLGLREFVRTGKQAAAMRKNTDRMSRLGESGASGAGHFVSESFNRADVPGYKRASIITGFGGSLFVIRPLTRMADAVVRSRGITRRIAHIIDSIYLRAESKSHIHPVFVGQGKP